MIFVGDMVLVPSDASVGDVYKGVTHHPFAVGVESDGVGVHVRIELVANGRRLILSARR